MCMNIYDVRKMDEWPACGMNWPPDLSDVYAFLRVSWGNVWQNGAHSSATMFCEHCTPRTARPPG
jgi:carboxypeptidase D